MVAPQALNSLVTAHRLMVATPAPASQLRVSVMVRVTILGILSWHSVQYTAWLSADTFRNLTPEIILRKPSWMCLPPVLGSQDHGNVLLRPQTTLIADHTGLNTKIIRLTSLLTADMSPDGICPPRHWSHPLARPGPRTRGRTCPWPSSRPPWPPSPDWPGH